MWSTQVLYVVCWLLIYFQLGIRIIRHWLINYQHTSYIWGLIEISGKNCQPRLKMAKFGTISCLGANNFFQGPNQIQNGQVLANRANDFFLLAKPFQNGQNRGFWPRGGPIGNPDQNIWYGQARPGQASQLLFLALGCYRLFLHDLKVRLQLQLQQEKKTINLV